MANIDGAGTPPEETTTDASNSTGYVDTGGPVDHDDSGTGGIGSTDAGSPGGMGGARASGGTSNGNPPGGISPVQIEQATRGDVGEEEG
jgi:hypothetical protein